MTLQPSQPQNSRPAAGEQSPVPVWWLQLTADDFNALQPLLTCCQLSERFSGCDCIITALTRRLRRWADYTLFQQQILDADLPDGVFQLERDVAPFMLAVARFAALSGRDAFPDLTDPDRANLLGRLFDLAFRIARHATAGRVGSPVTQKAC